MTQATTLGSSHAPALGITLAIVSVACGPAPPRTAPATAGSSATGSGTVKGSLTGRSLSVKSAVFMWRDKADDLELVLADSADLCASLSAGTWPRDATLLLFTIKHTGPDNRDAPFGAGEFPLREGSPRRPQDTKLARWIELDGSCAPRTTADATTGAVHLTTPEVRLGGIADGSFSIMMPDGAALEGTFSATYCAASEMEPHGCRRVTDEANLSTMSR